MADRARVGLRAAPGVSGGVEQIGAGSCPHLHGK
jgi:hypothetical protein